MKRWIFKPSEVMKLLQMLTHYLPSLDSGKRFVLEIREHHGKRSLDANAYAWVLINEIAGVMGLDPEQVYRDAVTKTGGNIEYLPVREDALKKWDRIWSSKGLGWQTEVLGPCKNLPGYVTVACYYGSHVFDAKQMSNLIENLVQDAKALGIDTRPPQERQQLVERWAS